MGITLFIGIFFAVGIFADMHKEVLEGFVSYSGIYGMVLYVAITALAVFAAPLSTFPLVPLAAEMYGAPLAGTLSMLGWLAGAVAVYVVFGIFHASVKKYPLGRKGIQIAAVVTKRNDPLTLIFLRMVLPVDVLSYALALFVSMSVWRYIWTTALGIAPFAFLLTYAANLDGLYQIAVLSGMGIFLLLSYIRIRTWYDADKEQLEREQKEVDKRG